MCWAAERGLTTTAFRPTDHDITFETRSGLISFPRPHRCASLGELIELFADWDGHGHVKGKVRLILGTEPFSTSRHSFRSDRMEFTEETRRYWIEEQGVSLLLSAKILRAIEQIEQGEVDIRFIHGASRLHAKIYVTERSTTVGSSNYTDFGLSRQIEANARFQLPTERRRYGEL